MENAPPITAVARNYVKTKSDESKNKLIEELQMESSHAIVSSAVEGDVLSDAFVTAGEKNHVDLFQPFFNHGMDVNIKDRNGYTALMYANMCGWEESTRWLLEHGANVDIRNYGYSALTFACCSGHKVLVKMLLEKNADPDFRCDSGMTALMFASQAGYRDIVSYLLSQNAQTELKNNDGKTAFDLSDDQDIVDLFRSHTSAGFLLK